MFSRKVSGCERKPTDRSREWVPWTVCNLCVSWSLDAGTGEVWCPGMAYPRLPKSTAAGTPSLFLVALTVGHLSQSEGIRLLVSRSALMKISESPNSPCIISQHFGFYRSKIAACSTLDMVGEGAACSGVVSVYTSGIPVVASLGPCDICWGQSVSHVMGSV